MHFPPGEATRTPGNMLTPPKKGKDMHILACYSFKQATLASIFDGSTMASILDGSTMASILDDSTMALILGRSCY